MTPLEPEAQVPSAGQIGCTPLPAPAAAELSTALRAALLDPALWRERLGEFARATDLAVALTNEQGRLLGEVYPLAVERDSVALGRIDGDRRMSFLPGDAPALLLRPGRPEWEPGRDARRCGAEPFRRGTLPGATSPGSPARWPGVGPASGTTAAGARLRKTRPLIRWGSAAGRPGTSRQADHLEGRCRAPGDAGTDDPRVEPSRVPPGGAPGRDDTATRPRADGDRRTKARRGHGRGERGALPRAPGNRPPQG